MEGRPSTRIGELVDHKARCPSWFLASRKAARRPRPVGSETPVLDGHVDGLGAARIEPQLIGLEAGATLAADGAVEVRQAAAVDVRRGAAVPVDGGQLEGSWSTKTPSRLSTRATRGVHVVR